MMKSIWSASYWLSGYLEQVNPIQAHILLLFLLLDVDDVIIPKILEHDKKFKEQGDEIKQIKSRIDGNFQNQRLLYGKGTS